MRNELLDRHHAMCYPQQGVNNRIDRVELPVSTAYHIVRERCHPQRANRKIKMHLIDRLKSPFIPLTAAEREANAKACEFTEKNNDKNTDELHIRSLKELRARAMSHMRANSE